MGLDRVKREKQRKKYLKETIEIAKMMDGATDGQTHKERGEKHLQKRKQTWMENSNDER